MGLERMAVSTKLAPYNLEFIEEWAKSLRPHPVSDSSLVDLCVSIVRLQARAGTLDLAPEALQVFLRNEGKAENGGNASKEGKARK